jgi:prephenate dehydratase
MSSDIIAYLGLEGSYSHQASQSIFPGQTYAGHSQFSSIFSAVEEGKAAYAVVPVDNALSGRIDGIYRELAKTTLNIVQEYILPIHHCLLTAKPAPGAPAPDYASITEIYSHPQGFLQCQNFIERHLPHAVLTDATDTAAAARDVAARGQAGLAAISSKVSATRYGLAMLAENIEDEPGNATRFLVLSRKGFEGSAPIFPALTTILFQTKHEPGSLVGALGAFSSQGVNLTKLETYMASKERRKPTFYVDVGEHLYAPRMAAAMAEFKKHVDSWKVLGTYPASPQRGVVSGFLTI